MRLMKPLFGASLAVMAGLLVACGGGDAVVADGSPGGEAAAAGFAIAVTPASLVVGQGQDAWIEVTITRDAGFTEAVRVSLNAPEVGITADSLSIPASQERATLAIHLDAALPPGSLHKIGIVASTAGESHAASTDLTLGAPLASAQSLIADARAAGAIDDATALLYRAYALLGDRRLPDAYLGAGSAEEDTALFTEIARGFAGLPAAAQDALLPFIVRPADPRSVWNATARAAGTRAHVASATRAAAAPTACSPDPATAGTWISKRSASFPVRVWAQCNASAAKDATSQTLIDNTLLVLDKVYTPMTTLMGPPQLDRDGGDNAIDFYLLDDGEYVYRRESTWQPRGYGTTYDDLAESIVGRGQGNSAFVTLSRSMAFGARFHNTVIHEFFHVLQKAHNADFALSADRELHWFVEASAAWASAHFDRTEAPWPDGRGAYSDAHQRFKLYFQPSAEALNASGSPHDYSAYIWSYFVEQETGSSAFMANIWRAMEAATTFEEADQVIDRVYPFATNFKKFALRNLNTEFLPGDPLPRSKRYVSLDPEQFADDKLEPPYLRGTLVADSDFSQALELKSLSARYLRLTVANDVSPVVKKVVFDTSALQPAAALDVQALVLTQNGWLAQPIDIGPDKVTFCFDDGPTTENLRGSFREIVLIVANHDPSRATSVSGQLKVLPSSQPCAATWQGSVDQTTTLTETFTGGSNRITITSTAQLAFELDPTAADLRNVFRLRSGSFVYRQVTDYVDPFESCHTVTTAGGPLHQHIGINDTSDGAADAILYTYVSGADPLPQWVLGADGSASASESLTAYTTATTTGQCSLRGDQSRVEHGFAMELWQTHALHDIVDDGSTIRGTYSYDNGAGTTQYTFLFKRTRE